MSFLMSRNKRNAVISAILLMFGYGLFNYTPGYFMEAVARDMDCSRVAFTLHSSIISVTAVITAPFFGKLIKKPANIRKIITIGAAAGALCYLSAAGIHRIYQLYIAALVLGLVANNCTLVCSIAIIEKAFSADSGIPTGIEQNQ